jgi:hypothetical protein
MNISCSDLKRKGGRGIEWRLVPILLFPALWLEKDIFQSTV